MVVPPAEGTSGGSWWLAAAGCWAASASMGWWALLWVRWASGENPASASLMPAMATLLVVVPLLGGIAVEPLTFRVGGYLLVRSALSVFRLRLGGARPWGRRGCRSGGSGFSPPLCCVEVFGCQLWLLGRLGFRLVWGRGLGAGVVCCVVWFSAGFPYKLSNSFRLYQAKALPRFEKRNTYLLARA